ncbi:metalloregulator ArsR/SmtB family transcription factor [Endozoicomonas ascidiicola]|uniref:metalloregulator ArsR/SmtB family transcription factor n=1 Tax=Endozoicomonas ascidiicola TaxID=1698521 RepID=UPI00082A9E7E|nr:metalloregulator ArsR/SmtB family transcription factor [Endozoicomonas ascidiicola]
MLPHQFFKLLSDETRLRCLLLIARHGPLRVSELTAALEESQPKISRHLAQLRNLGVFKDERQGQSVYYAIADNIPGWSRKVIEGLAKSNCLQDNYEADIQRLLSIPNHSD